MKRMFILFIIVTVAIGAFACTKKQELQTNGGTKQQEETPIDKEKPSEKEVEVALNPFEEKLAQMSLDEKLGQLILTGFQGTYLTNQTKELIHTYKVGGFILFAQNMEDPSYAVQLLNDIKIENKKNGIPVFLGVDQEGGRVTRLPGLSNLPTNAFIGAKDDEAFAYAYGELLGRQLQAFGFQFNFAPVMDVNSNPDNPVIGDRAFGKDPKLVSKMGIALMEGMQEEKVIPVIKHFPGHGDTTVDSHESMPTVNKTLAELEAMELIPFRRAIEAGVDVVMTSHIALPKVGSNIPATMSKEIITDLLREEIGFDGVVITDDLTMGAIADYGIPEAANEAIKAGVDIVLIAFGHDQIIETIERLRESVETGEITEARIDESVIRILRLKDKYDLADEINDKLDVDELQSQIHTLIK